MLHCVPAQIKSFKTTILDRGNKHEGERGTGGTMLIVRDHLCEGEGSPSACVFLFLFIVYFCIRLRLVMIFPIRNGKRPNIHGY